MLKYVKFAKIRPVRPGNVQMAAVAVALIILTVTVSFVAVRSIALTFDTKKHFLYYSKGL